LNVSGKYVALDWKFASLQIAELNENFHLMLIVLPDGVDTIPIASDERNIF
jgi:hypothetical protein